MYRDADNYKVQNEIVFQGQLTKKQTREIFAACNKTVENGFIPQQVGLEPLYPRLQLHDTRDWDVDHPWHELLAIRSEKADPTMTVSIQSFYDLFVTMKDCWNDAFKVGHILDK